MKVTNKNTGKLVFNDHPWDQKKVTAVDSWSLFGGHSCNKNSKLDMKNGGRYGQVVAIRRWTLAQV